MKSRNDIELRSNSKPTKTLRATALDNLEKELQSELHTRQLMNKDPSAYFEQFVIPRKERASSFVAKVSREHQRRSSRPDSGKSTRKVVSFSNS